jgi:hypothetical protein
MGHFYPPPDFARAGYVPTKSGALTFGYLDINYRLEIVYVIVQLIAAWRKAHDLLYILFHFHQGMKFQDQYPPMLSTTHS